MVKLYEKEEEKQSTAYIKVEQNQLGVELFLVDEDGDRITGSTIAVIIDSGELICPIDVDEKAAKKAGISLNKYGAIKQI